MSRNVSREYLFTLQFCSKFLKPPSTLMISNNDVLALMVSYNTSFVKIARSRILYYIPFLVIVV